MPSKSERREKRARVLANLDTVIQFLGPAGGACGFPPAQAALSSACALLTVIRDTLANERDFLDLAQTCAEVCEALKRGINGRESHELCEPVYQAVERLQRAINRIHDMANEKRKQGWFSGILNAKGDKDAIAGQKQELTTILGIFNTQLAINNHIILADNKAMLVDIHRKVQGGAQPHNNSNQSSISPGEFPPPAPKPFFGRNDLVEDIVDRAGKLEPFALIGAGGIGKTSIALAALHDSSVKAKFGDNRRFIRCDKFSASRATFLARLSEVIGAGIKNPDDLAQLRPFLSSKEIILFLDNAESILDPRGTDAQEIYDLVKELSHFDNICLGITSRISTIPPRCKQIEVPTLSMEAACDIFYDIYSGAERSGVINELLQHLDFHALSITLLAAAASHNKWDHNRLKKEWTARRTQVLRTDFNESLAAAIDLSLTSPTFLDLGPDARELLGAVAFFPQGVNEDNIDWLFPTISNRQDIFDKFCVLSLTSRSSGFVTMLAPVRDYLCPKDPRSSPLLRATRDQYFVRLSVHVCPEKPGFGEARWITSEDANVERLLDVFASTDIDLDDVWDACLHFMEHIEWHKPRRTILGLRIEGLPDDHPFKSKCLYQLSRLFLQLGNYAEEKRLLSHALPLEKQRGDDSRVAAILGALTQANWMLGLFEEGTRRAEEALEIHERLGDAIGQAKSLSYLAAALFHDNRLDAARDAASRAIDLDPRRSQKSHQILGWVYQSKGETEKAIHHFEVALEIASALNRQDHLFWIRLSLVDLFLAERRFDDANDHIKQVKLHAGDKLFYLGRATEMQASIWHQQSNLEDAKLEALNALEIYQKLGITKRVERCRNLLSDIEAARN